MCAQSLQERPDIFILSLVLEREVGQNFMNIQLVDLSAEFLLFYSVRNVVQDVDVLPKCAVDDSMSDGALVGVVESGVNMSMENRRMLSR